MEKKSYWLMTCLNLLLSSVPALCFLYIQDELPNVVPIHYNAQGVADRFVEKDSMEVWGLILLPFFMFAFMRVLWMVLSLFLKKGDNTKVLKKIEIYIDFFMIVIFACIAMFWLVGVQQAESKNDIFLEGRVLIGILGCMNVVLGNMMPKLKRNKWIGCRTRYSLSGDEEWEECQRFSGKWLKIGGVAVFVLMLIPFLSNKTVVIIGGVSYMLAMLVPLIFVPRKKKE